MDAIILDDITFDAPLEMFVERMRIQKRPAIIEELRDLLEEATPIAQPKVMFREATIETKGEDFVVIDGVTLHSRDLRERLDPLQRAFPAIVTCGTELARWSEHGDSMFSRFIAEAICEAAMINAQSKLAEYAANHLGAKKINYILPGTLDWPLAEQQKLFALLGDTSPIGVTLTAHGTMRPIKTVSALYYEGSVPFVSA